MSEMPFEYEPGTARQILEDHGLTEVAIDGVLYRHAHELAEKIRELPLSTAVMAFGGIAAESQRRGFNLAADLIDPETSGS